MLLDKLSGDDESALPAEARDWAGLVAAQQRAAIGQALAGAEQLLGRSGVQAYCLECPKPAAAQIRTGGEDNLGLLARISRLLGLL